MSQAQQRGGFPKVTTGMQARMSLYRPVQRIALSKIQHAHSCLSRRARRVAPTIPDRFPTQPDHFPTRSERFPTDSRPPLLLLTVYPCVGVWLHRGVWTCFAVHRREQQV